MTNVCDRSRSAGSSKHENENSTAWYCLRSRRKQEHVAAAHVKVLGDIPVFCPRIRFRRRTKTGTTLKVNEALFPGYLFAQFSLREMLPQVRSAHGVSGVLRFGNWYPIIEDDVIDDLRIQTGDGDVREVVPELVAGDRVRLVEGPLAGLEAVITHVLPGNERVRLLLEFLGRETVAEAKAEHVVLGEEFGSTLFRFAARLAVPVARRLNVDNPPRAESNSHNGVHAANIKYDEIVHRLTSV
jgi:transcriptional antiterminator RfaH